MDSGLKKKQELANLARALLSHSQRLEPGPAPGFTQMQQSLQLLGSLAAIARESIPVAKAAPAAPETPAAPKSSALAAARARLSGRAARPPAPRPVTARQEYQPALKDQGVIDALLEFHRGTVQAQRELKPLSAFAPLAAPEVQAQPKKAPNFRKGPGISYPILRPKPSDES
ncbi:MAG: hypothetical protein NDJ89_05720 [Oligoflexia bacterium]|nr:hypothetical protein [Oligoflexia bacterium]